MIYEPAEDSYLLSRVLKKQIPKFLKQNSNIKFLEIGSGSGIQLQTALELGIKRKNIFATDINSLAIENCRNLGFNCIKSNLFEKIKGKYDIIIFNPPYLPEDKREPKNSRIATTGGIYGGEIINLFLEQSKKHLNKKGRIFILISSLTKKINFKGFRKKVLAREKIFFEELKVLELK